MTAALVFLAAWFVGGAIVLRRTYPNHRALARRQDAARDRIVRAARRRPDGVRCEL
jgi:hypothetical protein